MRERLIEMCENLILSCKSSLYADCEHNKIDYPHCMSVHFADYLLDNGVIVPPCKVGDLLCVIYEEQILPVSVRTVYITRNGLKIEADYTNHIIYIKPEHFGKEVFYNFAEANAKLKEGAEEWK